MSVEFCKTGKQSKKPSRNEHWAVHCVSSHVQPSLSMIDYYSSSAVKKQGVTSSHIQVAVKKVDVTCEWVSNYLHGCRNCYTFYENPMCTTSLLSSECCTTETVRTSMISPITWQPGNGIAYFVLIPKTSCPPAIKTCEQCSVYFIL